MRLVELVVGEKEALLPLHALLRDRMGMPRRLLRRLWTEGAVLVDGQSALPWQRPRPGAFIEVHWNPPPASGAEDLPLSVVWEDEDVLVVDKPAGMVCHPTHGVGSGTLAGALKQHCGAAHLVQRLDRETSGLLLAARHPWAAARLGEAMARRTIRRQYLALVQGTRASWPQIIEAPIGRNPETGDRRVDPTGQSALTRIMADEACEGGTWLRLALETGRTHQIRVHLAHLGHPVVGDPRYGSGRACTRMALHAAHLVFLHPRTAAWVTISAPWPCDLPSEPTVGRELQPYA
ncbi:MAG: RluA family pseudouridine synthase [Candidatus Sericytochromatia bacterium]|nr:RluA family pseudouridine synthase [Candidatus Sericytochromatia bacterium]